MTDDDKIVLDDVRRLDVRPGDVLFVSVRGRVSPDVAARITQSFKTALPDVRVFVGDEGTDVSVIREEAA